MQSKNTKTYTIREVSALFHLPASTLRYYEETGILPAVPKTSGRRIYSQLHMDRLYAIECFKNTGMSIARIKDFFTYEETIETNIDNMLSLLSNQKIILEEKLSNLQNSYKHIQCKLEYYSAVKKAVDDKRTIPDWNEFFCK